MQIILVSQRSAAKTLTLTRRHFLAAGAGVVSLVALLAFGIAELGLATGSTPAGVVAAAPGATGAASDKSSGNTFVDSNLQVMATRIGELQAKLLEMGAINERLSSLSGIKPPPKPEGKPGEGGPLVISAVSMDTLGLAINQLAKESKLQSDFLTAVESRMLEQRIRQLQQPTSHPAPGAQQSSGFGFRSDPIHGGGAMHSGLDFRAPVGTPAHAAAAGIVVEAHYHPEYGNVVDVDHGNQLTTRYAHLSRIDVAPGQLVRRGQQVGAIGTTGRSTGPHLHFEVRLLGVAQNPANFLSQGYKLAAAADAADAKKKH